MPTEEGLILVTGGNGFIGGHLARRLVAQGRRVRVADVCPTPYLETSGVELVVGSLLDPVFCARAIRGVTIVVHFAATMGGMGVIHADNNFVIYHENHTMTLNLLSASVSSGIQRFLYASSACVYPDALQGQGNTDVSLRETDVYAQLPPCPQGLYGLEKLHTEQVLHQYAERMEVRIARFHNIYGPGGSWKDGREKAPAALLRKMVAAKLADEPSPAIEIWGDGQQRRSFCFIDDAVDAIIRLLHSDCRQPVNIGSDRAVTITELANIAARVTGLDSNSARYRYLTDKPVGVGSRNSNNDFIRRVLQWTPATSLEDGMLQTGRWILGETKKLLSGADSAERADTLRRLQTSGLVDLRSHALMFAILLPITSRGTADPSECLKHLATFARSLASTTAYDVGHSGRRYGFRIYLAIDSDDAFLLEQSGPNKPEQVLRAEGILQIDTIVCNHPRGHVCSIWRDCARKAWLDGCQYFVLMGDDVVLQDMNWMSAIHNAFTELAVQESVPEGFGCVAFTDTSFPGMPTFPVVHHTHMEIFGGEVIPGSFVNQDGDPFLFQLYRRWNCSRMIPLRISNILGGSKAARYVKVSAPDWTFRPLGNATETVENWLRLRRPHIAQKLTLDVIVPCYRVDLSYLRRFLELQPSPTCTVMYIIIIDDPQSPNIKELLSEYSHRPDVRIRINRVNSGASASRNRGLRESSAEWVIFLDDDVTPNKDVLIETEKAIRANPDAAGFVGTALFPPADTIATAAIHLAGVTYFWDIARKRADDDDLPWGVTANLITRRNVEDHVEYDLMFPKTGGGEDIDYCRRKRNYSMRHGGKGFCAAPRVVVTHPWWNNGKRSYWRFYMWSKGDGALIGLYPEFTYREVAPNSAESILACVLIIFVGCITAVGNRMSSPGGLALISLGIRMVFASFTANILHDLYRHLWRDANRLTDINMSVRGFSLVLAVIESTLIRVFSEYGRTVGMLERKEYRLIGRSFDWFTGRAGNGPRNEENRNRLQRVSLSVVIFATLLSA